MLDNAGTKLGSEMLDTQFATQMTGMPGGLSRSDRAPARAPDGQRRTAPTPAAASKPVGSTARAADFSALNGQQRQVAFVQAHREAAQEAESQTGIPATFMLAQAAHESGWGQREIQNADGSSANNLFGIKAGAGWKGAVAEVTTTEFVDGQPKKTVQRFRAYASAADSFRDYAQLMTGSSRYSTGARERRRRAALRAGPAGGRLRDRSGLCRQARARHQHHLARAAHGGLIRTNATASMSNSALMSIGTRAMTASYAALQTTGNNIANANTVGYSRQQVELAHSAGQYTAWASSARAST